MSDQVEEVYQCTECGEKQDGRFSICLRCFSDNLKWIKPLKFKKDG